jgi:hypothetical protein
LRVVLLAEHLAYALVASMDLKMVFQSALMMVQLTALQMAVTMENLKDRL